MQDDALPVGFRFYPTEEELVCYYLRCRYAEQRFPNVVRDLDIYEYEPWELHSKSPLKPRRNPETGKVTKEADFFFFTVSSNKYGNGPRKKRGTEQGYWKATGRDREVSMEEKNSTAKKKIGMKKTLVFYKGRAPHGGRTDWILNEYRLDPGPDSSKEYVINRVFNKRGDPTNQGLASDPLQSDEHEVAEEADTDSPNDSGHGANGGTPGDSVGHLSADQEARASPEAVQWLGSDSTGDPLASQFFREAGQEGEDGLDWHMPDDCKMEDAEVDWKDIEAWYESRTEESECSLPWGCADGVSGPHTPGGGEMSWHDCLMLLDQTPPPATAQPFAHLHPALGHPSNPTFDLFTDAKAYLPPPLVRECESSTTADPFGVPPPAKIQIRARPVGWGAGPPMGGGGVARRVRMAVRPRGEGQALRGAALGKGTEAGSKGWGSGESPVEVVGGRVEGSMPRLSEVSRRAADRALILRPASSGSRLRGSIEGDGHNIADLLAAVECEERVAEEGGAAEGQPWKGAEEEQNGSRSQCSPADARGGGGSEADPSAPTGDERHGRERQKGKAAVEKAMAESGDGRSGVGSGVRNQRIFGRCQERTWEGKQNAESRRGLLSQEQPLGESRSYVLGLMGGLFCVLAILWPFVRLGKWIPWLVGLMSTE